MAQFLMNEQYLARIAEAERVEVSILDVGISSSLFRTYMSKALPNILKQGIEHGVFTAAQAEQMYPRYKKIKAELLVLNRHGMTPTEYAGVKPVSLSKLSAAAASDAKGKRSKKSSGGRKRKATVLGGGAVDAGMSVATSEGIGTQSFS